MRVSYLPAKRCLAEVTALHPGDGCPFTVFMTWLTLAQTLEDHAGG